MRGSVLLPRRFLLYKEVNSLRLGFFRGIITVYEENFDLCKTV